MHNVNLQRREIQIGSRTLSIETGKLAKQAHGSVVVRCGDTMVLVAASRAASRNASQKLKPNTPALARQSAATTATIASMARHSRAASRASGTSTQICGL